MNLCCSVFASGGEVNHPPHRGISWIYNWSYMCRDLIREGQEFMLWAALSARPCLHLLSQKSEFCGVKVKHHHEIQSKNWMGCGRSLPHLFLLQWGRQGLCIHALLWPLLLSVVMRLGFLQRWSYQHSEKLSWLKYLNCVYNKQCSCWSW